MGQCGIRLVGRSRKLNYRTTDEIRRFASAMLKSLRLASVATGVTATGELFYRSNSVAQSVVKH